MNRSLATVSLLVALAVAPACGPSTNDGDDGANPSSGTTTDAQGSDSEASTAGTTTSEPTTTDPDTGSDTTAPVDCDALGIDECPPACHSVSGTEATPTGEPGEYYCSDLRLPFACTAADCEPFSGDMILCELDELGAARWVLDDCIPVGWEPCPDAICA